MVRFLMARGADPRRKLPFDSGKTVIALRRGDQEPDAGVARRAAPGASPIADGAGRRPTRPAAPGAA